MSANQVETDVAIVGFGPIGATLAALLGRRGIGVIVIDQDVDVYALPRAAHIDHQSLRLLQELGCVDELLVQMLPNPGVDFVTASRELLMRIPGNLRSVSGLPASMYFHQPSFDRVIRRVANALAAVDVRLGTRMVALEMGEHGAVLHTHGPAGAKARIAARWVIGCDGAGSMVRGAAELPLENLDFDERWVVVDLVLRRAVATLPNRAITVCDAKRPLFAIPLPGSRFRFELQMHDDENPLEIQKPASVFALLSEWLEPEDGEIERAAVYRFHGLVARPWRRGPVFLAGDAAHQMPPFLGQGMNSGLRDAANLAWKLAMVVGGKAPDRLLDTYEGERRPHVTEIVQAAVRYGAIICETDPALAAERDRRWLDHSGPPEGRLPFKLPSLVPGPLVLAGGGELFPQPEASAAAVRLDDFLSGRFLVVVPEAQRALESARWWSGLGAMVCALEDLPDPSGQVATWMEKRSVQTVVVRPDHYVLASGQSLDTITGMVRSLLSVT